MRAVYRRRARGDRAAEKRPGRCKSGHARAGARDRAPCEAAAMNTLTDAQRDRVLGLLREGKTLRRIEHETGHRRETIAAYGRRAGRCSRSATCVRGPWRRARRPRCCARPERRAGPRVRCRRVPRARSRARAPSAAAARRASWIHALQRRDHGNRERRQRDRVRGQRRERRAPTTATRRRCRRPRRTARPRSRAGRGARRACRTRAASTISGTAATSCCHATSRSRSMR